MSGGKLVKILLKTRVSRYLEWKCKYLNKCSHRRDIRTPEEIGWVLFKRRPEDREGASDPEGGIILWPDGLDGEEKVSEVHGRHAKLWVRQPQDSRRCRVEQTGEGDVLKIRTLGEHNWLHWPRSCPLHRRKLYESTSHRRYQKDPTLHGLDGQVRQLTLHLPCLWTRRYSWRILQDQCSQRRHFHAQHWHQWDPLRRWKGRRSQRPWWNCPLHHRRMRSHLCSQVRTQIKSQIPLKSNQMHLYHRPPYQRHRGHSIRPNHHSTEANRQEKW